MRVIVYEPTNLDIEKAHKFGNIEYMFNESDSRPSIWETEEFVEACSRRLDELKFDPNVDSFVVAGASVPLTAITSLMSRKYKEFKVLFWHSSVRDYLTRVL